MLTTLVSAALAEVTTRQNEDMRKISAWAAIALVPTAIAGVYGMNFDHIPGAGSPFGFAICVGLMTLVCVLLYYQLDGGSGCSAAAFVNWFGYAPTGPSGERAGRMIGRVDAAE